MRKLLSYIHQSWLIVGLCIGIIVGTILATIFRWQFFSSYIWLIFVAIVFIIAFFKPNLIFVGAMMICGVIIASFRMTPNLAGEDIFTQLVNQKITISGILTEDPDVETNTTKVKLKNITLNENNIEGLVYIQLAGSNLNLQRDDKITVTGKITEGFGNFSGAMYRPTLDAVYRAEPGDIFLNLRNWFAERVKKYVPEEESKLSLAYLLGMKNGLDDDMMEILRLVGLTHIVVASGTHLGIITSFMKKIFGKISKFAGVFFSILLILVFGGIIGWTASITRAAIVTILSLTFWYVGREFEPWRLILLAMATTLIIDPTFLINIGWLLSFGSYIGIMILTPIVTRFFYGEDEPNKVMEILIATISAQLLCIPVTFYYFGCMSIISLLANLLILPTIPIAMGVTFATGVLAFPIIGDILGKITEIIIKYHTIVMEFCSKQTMFLIEIEPGDARIFLLYIVILAPFVIFFIKTKIHERKLKTSV